MKKIFTIALGVLMAVASWANTVTYDFQVSTALDAANSVPLSVNGAYVGRCGSTQSSIVSSSGIACGNSKIFAAFPVGEAAVIDFVFFCDNKTDYNTKSFGVKSISDANWTSIATGCTNSTAVSDLAKMFTAVKTKIIPYKGSSEQSTWKGKEFTVSDTVNAAGKFAFYLDASINGSVYLRRIVVRTSGGGSSTTYTITYDLNGHGESIAQVSGVTALPATLPTPTADGYTFGGWYTDENLTQEATAGATISANTTLYAKWTESSPSPTTYTITYNLNGHGESIAQVSGVTALPATLPAPTADGYTFGGWYTDENLTQEATAGATISANTTLYAKWTENGESSVTDITLVGSSISASVSPLTSVVYGVDQTYTSGDYGYAGGLTGSSGKRYISFTIPTGYQATVDAKASATSGRVLALVTKAVYDAKTFSEATSKLWLTMTGSDVSGTSSTLSAGTYYIGSTGSSITLKSLVVHVSSAGGEDPDPDPDPEDPEPVVPTTGDTILFEQAADWHTTNLSIKNLAAGSEVKWYKNGALMATSDTYAADGIGKYSAVVTASGSSTGVKTSNAVLVECAPEYFDVNISAVKYATLYLDYAVTIPDGVTAYTVTYTNQEITLSQIEDGIIPAETGVILYSEQGKYRFVESEEAGTATSGLYGTLVALPNADAPAGKNYILANKTSGVGFYKWTSGTLGAHKAYLNIPEGAAAPDRFIFNREDNGVVTALSDYEIEPDYSKCPIYTITGIRVKNMDTPGVYICGGKKFVVF